MEILMAGCRCCCSEKAETGLVTQLQCMGDLALEAAVESILESGKHFGLGAEASFALALHYWRLNNKEKALFFRARTLVLLAMRTAKEGDGAEVSASHFSSLLGVLIPEFFHEETAMRELGTIH